jgi:hypothetical protein
MGLASIRLSKCEQARVAFSGKRMEASPTPTLYTFVVERHTGRNLGRELVQDQ